MSSSHSNVFENSPSYFDGDMAKHLHSHDDDIHNSADEVNTRLDSNKKTKRANVNWSTQAELELVNLILLHKAHLKRSGNETQEEKWTIISRKLGQGQHFHGQKLTTGQVQMKWNRLTKRIQDRYSVEIEGAVVCHLPENPDEVTKGVFDILCEAEAKNTDKVPINKDKKRNFYCLSNDMNELGEHDIMKQPITTASLYVGDSIGEDFKKLEVQSFRVIESLQFSSIPHLDDPRCASL